MCAIVMIEFLQTSAQIQASSFDYKHRMQYPGSCDVWNYATFAYSMVLVHFIAPRCHRQCRRTGICVIKPINSVYSCILIYVFDINFLLPHKIQLSITLHCADFSTKKVCMNSESYFRNNLNIKKNPVFISTVKVLI